MEDDFNDQVFQEVKAAVSPAVPGGRVELRLPTGMQCIQFAGSSLRGVVAWWADEKKKEEKKKDEDLLFYGLLALYKAGGSELFIRSADEYGLLEYGSSLLNKGRGIHVFPSGNSRNRPGELRTRAPEEDFLSTLESVGLVEHVLNDPELNLEFQGTEVNVYYLGHNVLKLGAHGRYQLGPDSKEVPCKIGRLRTLSEAAGLVCGFRQAKEAIDGIPRLNRLELAFESEIARGHHAHDLPKGYICIDRQVTFQGWNRRIDMLMVNPETGKLAVAEVKRNNGDDQSSPVQALMYAALIYRDGQFIRETYETVYRQKKKLGILPTGLPPTVSLADERPEAWAVVGGEFTSEETEARARMVAEDLSVRVCHVPPKGVPHGG